MIAVCACAPVRFCCIYLARACAFLLYLRDCTLSLSLSRARALSLSLARSLSLSLARSLSRWAR